MIEDSLSHIKLASRLYSEGKSITRHFLADTQFEFDERAINIIYENVAGSYTEKLFKDFKKKELFVQEILHHAAPFILDAGKILDVGIGEGTTASPLLNLSAWRGNYFGVDLSLSRLTWAAHILQNFLPNNAQISLSSANMSALPFPSNYMDLVLTVYALEPNGNAAEKLVREIARVSKEYIVLVEPDYFLASKEQRERMKTLGYIPDLRPIFSTLELDLIKEAPIETSPNLANKSSIFILRKKAVNSSKSADLVNHSEIYTIPGTDYQLNRQFNGLYSSEIGVFFPYFFDIPLLKETDGQLLLTPKFTKD